jgi:hypothetical protein
MRWSHAGLGLRVDHTGRPLGALLLGVVLVELPAVRAEEQGACGASSSSSLSLSLSATMRSPPPLAPASIFGTSNNTGGSPPAGKSALPSHFVLDCKRDGRYKARLVAGGNHQQPGVDFNDTFVPVCSYRTLRMIVAVAARHGLAV